MPTLYIKRGKRYVHIGISKGIDDHGGDNFIRTGDWFLTDRMTLAPGLWLSTSSPNCKSLCMVSKISEIPSDPYNYTAIKVERNELATYLTKFIDKVNKNNDCSTNPAWKIMPSNSEIVDAILDYLVKKANITMEKHKKQDTERRLDPDL